MSGNIKNITLSAEGSLIEKARIKAQSQKRSLNQVFKEFLHGFVGGDKLSRDYDLLMDKLKKFKATRKFSRDEMNER